jgi:glutamine amidotransferase-like uncharacterized protein
MNNKNQKKIIVFSEGAVSASSVLKSLGTNFRKTSINLTNSHAIKHDPVTLNENTLAFVLPGIVGEHSPYKELLGKEGNQRIRNYVKNGGVFIGFCAGAYYACQSIYYRTPWGITKSQNPGLNFFNATAQGPIANQGRKAEENDRWSDVTLTFIEYEDENGTLQKSGVCYGNGPALTNIKDKELKIIANYSKVPGKPVAMASKQIGKGLAIFVGVHPEISSEHVQKDTAFIKQPHIKRLVSLLSPHEEDRKLLWVNLTNMIKNHNIKLGRAQKSLLEKRL